MGKRFAADISRILKKAGKHMDAVAQLTCQDLAIMVVDGGNGSPGTPVDTGNARGHWQPSLNSAELAVGTGEPLGQIALVTAKMKAGDRFFMLNNAAYILRLEYGWSQQAPQGMVRITLAKAKQVAEANIRLVRGLK